MNNVSPLDLLKKNKRVTIYRYEGNYYVNYYLLNLLKVYDFTKLRIGPGHVVCKITPTDIKHLLQIMDENNISIPLEYIDVLLPVDYKTPKINVIPDAVYFVYRSNLTGKYYIPYYVCERNHVGNSNNRRVVEGKECYEITFPELETIQKNECYEVSFRGFDEAKTADKSEIKTPEKLDVVRVDGKFFMPEAICVKRHYGDTKNYAVIDGKVYYHISVQELAEICIEERKSFTIRKLQKDMIQYYEEKVEADHEFTVYTYNNHYFVEDSIIKQFHLETIGKKIRVNGVVYYEIDALQVAIVEGSSIYGIWKAQYQQIVPKKQEPVKSSLFTDEDYSDELIPGTNIYKPRGRGVYETDEEYVLFLARYYYTFFPNSEGVKKYMVEHNLHFDDIDASRKVK